LTVSEIAKYQVPQNATGLDLTEFVVTQMNGTPLTSESLHSTQNNYRLMFQQLLFQQGDDEFSGLYVTELFFNVPYPISPND